MATSSVKTNSEHIGLRHVDRIKPYFQAASAARQTSSRRSRKSTACYSGIPRTNHARTTMLLTVSSDATAYSHPEDTPSRMRRKATLETTSRDSRLWLDCDPVTNEHATQPRVDVIVATYNAEERIERAVRSILEQTYRNTYILICNDASSDNTRRKCRELVNLDDRVCYFELKRRSGVAAARNIGLSFSSAEYIAFVDDDDELEPHLIERMILRSAGEDDCLCIAPTIEYDSPGETNGTSEPICMDIFDACLSSKRERTQLTLSTMRAARFRPGAVWGKLFSGRTIREHRLRFDEHMSRFEDTAFICSYMAKCKKALFVSGTHYIYHRERAGSLSKQRSNLSSRILLGKHLLQCFGVMGSTKYFLTKMRGAKGGARRRAGS